MSPERVDEAQAAQPRAAESRLLSMVLVLGLLSTFAPISIDMYLPSLPTIGREYLASAGDVQLTLSAFFIGFALGQLFWGPLSDKFGRRPMLIAGVVLFIVTSALCALSTSIGALTGFRALQALGGGAGTVIARGSFGTTSTPTMAHG